MKTGRSSGLFPALAVFAFLFLCHCATGRNSNEGGGGDSPGEKGSYRKPETYNLVLTLRDAGITDPSLDRRCYYRVVVDKAEEGRTSIALESQVKTFEALLGAERHLLTFEKWVLDEKAGKYVKLNNIDQPRPNYLYVDIQEGRIIRVTVVVTEGRARFSVESER